MEICTTKHTKANSQQAVAELNARQKTLSTEVYWRCGILHL